MNVFKGNTLELEFSPILFKEDKQKPLKESNIIRINN